MATVRKVLKIVLIVMAVGLVAIQFVRPNFTNPPIVPGETLQSTTNVPAEVDNVLGRSCNDCHSNETVYPWYSRVTPFNWFLADHIDAGRSDLNFSVWNTYPTDRKIRKLDEICEQVESKAMPLPSYLWIHGDAALSKPEGEMLCSWARAESERLSSQQ